MEHQITIRRSEALSQSAWERLIADTVQHVLDQFGTGEMVAVRKVATYALMNVAAGFAVHDIDCLTPDGDLVPGAIDGALDDFALSARVALSGEIASCGLREMDHGAAND